MKNLMDRIVNKRYHLILEECDLIETLRVINKHHRVVPEMRVGNCGWVDTNKWFIHFTSTEFKWRLIRDELKVIRVFETCDIPEHMNGVVYSTD